MKEQELRKVYKMTQANLQKVYGVNQADLCKVYYLNQSHWRKNLPLGWKLCTMKLHQ